MSKNLLPIGSIVEVSREQAPLFMVMGYFPQTDADSTDYLVVPYPVGALLESSGILVDEADISRVVHQGFLDGFGQGVLAEASELMTARLDYSLE